MRAFIVKLTSRKFITAVAGVVFGIAMALGADTNEVSTVAGAVTTLISVVTYIVVEGKVDAEGVKNAIIEVQEGIETIEGTEE